MGKGCKWKITHVDQSYGGTSINELSEAASSMSASQLRSPVSEPQINYTKLLGDDLFYLQAIHLFFRMRC
ncbi:unnamed protein product [Urochloa humidicola]